MMQKKIILCADDYGQNTNISEGILDLVAKKRLNAVSCMVNGLAWPSHAKHISSYPMIQWGLHLNLTHGYAISKPLAFTSLLGLVKKCYFPSTEFKNLVEQEVQAQILQFKQDVGFWPQFIDGHQHVHQLPVIRHALIKTVKQLEFKPWFRITSSINNFKFRDLSSWKKWALLVLGGHTWQKLLVENQFQHPHDFAGEYSFHQAKHYRHIFLKAAKKLKNGGLIMCHPGLEGLDENDPISLTRGLEYQYFNSSEFVDDIKCLHIRLF